MAKKEGRINAAIDAELMEKGKALAAAQGISFSSLLCKLLATYVEKNAETLANYEKAKKELAKSLGDF